MRIICLCALLVYSLFAQTEIEQKAADSRNIQIDKNLTTVNKTYKDATQDPDSKNWNTKDWENHMNKNGVDSGLIGNTQNQVKGFTGAKEGLSGNPNAMQTDALQSNQSYKDAPSIKAWNNNLLNSIISSTTKHAVNSNILDSTTKCYITRDIPIRYKCEFTKITYGGDIDSNGIKAKNQCESECYEQFEAVEIVKEGTIADSDMSNILLEATTATKIQDFSKTLTVDNKVSSITFENVVTDNKYYFISISIIDKDGKLKELVKKNRVNTSSLVNEFVINQLAKEIRITVQVDNNTKAELKNIKIHFNGGKYICPNLQDITNSNPGKFAYLCPSGNIKKFSKGYKTYTICADYGIFGDNIDGTFSQSATANSICKKNYGCNIDISTINTNVLQNFREGCIEGQANCSPNTCKELRLSNSPILHENVFDAGLYPIQSIVNEAQVQGVNRPRILLSEDLDYQSRTAEELKDQAYLDMINKKKYVVSNVTFDQNTLESNASNIGLSNTSNIYAGSAKRALYWVYKPDAYMVNNVPTKLYSIFDVIVSKKKYDESGKQVIVKDRIMYIKTGDNDYLKAFARKNDYAQNIIAKDSDGYNQYINSDIASSTWKYTSFNENTLTWYAHSYGMTAEYFQNAPITLDDKPYLRIRLLSEINNLVYLFPGIKRSVVKNGPNEIVNYTSSFDGSGETISKITVYVITAQNQNYTYQDILNKIENKEISPIYDSLAGDTYAKEVVNDAGKVGGDIQLFLYGKKENKTGYVRMYPRKEDVGRNGFVFIFAVEE